MLKETALWVVVCAGALLTARGSENDCGAGTTSGCVVLTNTQWQDVNVEVRRGSESDCSKNAAYGTRLLERDEYWRIPPRGHVVCYRRDLVPGIQGEWSGWRKVQDPGAATVEVEIR